jgi:hypothetical protein
VEAEKEHDRKAVVTRSHRCHGPFVHNVGQGARGERQEEQEDARADHCED